MWSVPRRNRLLMPRAVRPVTAGSVRIGAAPRRIISRWLGSASASARAGTLSLVAPRPPRPPVPARCPVRAQPCRWRSALPCRRPRPERGEGGREARGHRDRCRRSRPDVRPPQRPCTIRPSTPASSAGSASSTFVTSTQTAVPAWCSRSTSAEEGQPKVVETTGRWSCARAGPPWPGKSRRLSELGRG